MRTKPVRWWDLPAAIFLTIALFAAVLRLQTTNWTPHLSLVQWLVLIGLVLGLALGKSRFGPRVSFLFGFIFTITLVPWALCTLIRSELWLERLQSLWGRLVAAGGQLVANKPVDDAILILGFLCLLFWLAALIAGYQLTRHARPWFGILVAGVIVLIVDYSFEMFAAVDTGTALSLVFFLFSVILVARVYYLRSQSDWNERGQMVENEVGFDISRGAAIAALGLVLVSWLSPRVIKSFTPGTLESRRLSEQFQAFRDRISNAVSSLNSQAPLFVETLGSSLALGSSTNLSQETVFSVKPEEGRLTGGRYYWTGRVYDAYVNGQWVSTETQPAPFGLGLAPTTYTYIGRREVSVTVTSHISLLRTLYFPSPPISITREVEAEIFPKDGDNPEITALISQPPLRAGESYQVRAAISAPTVAQMLASTNLEYPDWVTERYLQLPPGILSRISDLAKKITAGETTPYGKATAVTSWLRSNIEYQTVLPEIPSGVDPIVWFLYNSKVGFCNYYASAEVLLLRSLGIPARMVVGYAEGTWNPEVSEFEVAGKDYHAWPEVFFPDVGWVPFEPTSSQPVLTYPSDNNQANSGTSSGPAGGIPTPFIPPSSGTSLEDLAAIRALQEEANRQATARAIGIGGGTLSAGLLAFALYRWRKYTLKSTPIPTWFEQTLSKRGMRAPRWLVNWSVRARRTPMENYFARVPEMLRVWGQPADLDLTPSEQVQRLVKIVPEVSGPAQALLAEYEHAAYSRRHFDAFRARQAADDLRLKGYQTWFKRLIRFDI